MKKLRFGILGAGKIAAKFTEATHNELCRDLCEIVAVASRTPGKSETFAAQNSIPTHYDSYEALLADDSVDCVYVANTPNFHYDCVMAAIRAGKAVLCEKPLVTSEKLAREIFCAAREAGVLVMEALWSRYLPQVKLAKSYVEEGRIGSVIHVDTCFSIYRPYSPTARLYHPELQGGALNDLGIYNISITSYLLGEYPSEYKAYGSFSPEGMDAHTAALLRFPSGTTANMVTGICFEAKSHHTFYGTKGRLHLEGSYNGCARVTLTENTDEGPRVTETSVDFPNGFEYEIIEFVDLYRRGELESRLQSAEDSIRTAALLEGIAASSRE